MQILEIIIGIVFVMLLFSLFATTIMEMIAGLFALRGENLRTALRHILAHDGDDSLFKEFENNVLYKQLASKRFWRSKSYRPPSYMSSKSFWNILSSTLFDKTGNRMPEIRERINTLTEEGKVGEYLNKILLRLLDEADAEDGLQNKIKALRESVDGLPEGNIRRTVLEYTEKVENRVDRFEKKVENWYDTVMARSSGWYKRQTQYILFAIGVIIAVGFNADTIAIYKHLASDPTLALQIASQAEGYLDENANMPVTTPADRQLLLNVQNRLVEINRVITNDVTTLESPLGIGWQVVHADNMSISDWLIKVAGWLVTALSITLGAPFWFDLLRKLIHIRHSGSRA